MVDKSLELLLAAGGKPKNEIGNDNLFSKIGFDGDSPRLGWVVPPLWPDIKEALSGIEEIIRDKEEFIFVGMGGSVNGIKTLAALQDKSPVYYLDSLDPLALANIMSEIKDKDKLMVIPISKSGSTVETQLLAGTLAELFRGKEKEHFLWLSDCPGFEKLDSLGWEGIPKKNIQVDRKADVGGRFSSPHTLIFLLPLFLLLGRDYDRLESIWREYIKIRENLLPQAQRLAVYYSGQDKAFFSVKVIDRIQSAIVPWVTQLFQESLGSKNPGFYAKTLVNMDAPGFLPVKAGFDYVNDYAYIMAMMHFFHLFVALFAAEKNINFVSQPCVEEYKKTMRSISSDSIEVPPLVDLDSLGEEIENNLKPGYEFIECVLYFYPRQNMDRKISDFLKERFKDKIPFISFGSDWNHTSFQAAFADKKTLYVILSLKDYGKEAALFSKEKLRKNIDNMRIISLATHKSLKDNSIYFSL